MNRKNNLHSLFLGILKSVEKWIWSTQYLCMNEKDKKLIFVYTPHMSKTKKWKKKKRNFTHTNLSFKNKNCNFFVVANFIIFEDILTQPSCYILIWALWIVFLILIKAFKNFKIPYIFYWTLSGKNYGKGTQTT